MSPKDLRQETSAFFDAFVHAFAKFDGQLIAARYMAPYLALNADGTVRCFTEQAAIGCYFQCIVDTYQAQGCRACRYKDLDVFPLGQQSALASVTWQLLREDGGVMSSWRESYNLVRREDGLRIFASVDHVK